MATRYEHADRAKQFAPFDALTGLHEAIRKRERVVVERPELSEEKKDELDLALASLSPGKMASVIYYSGGELIKKVGMVAKVDLDAKVLTLVKTRINILDIVELEAEESGPV
ncbi:MAG: YolD-like family protein [Lachnospiraceae bacterium]|nr:YolD-like family protein [Lachnospiraceae bacterium]